MRVIVFGVVVALATTASAPAQGPLHSNEGFTAPPDMLADEILNQCVAFAEAASADEYADYTVHHTDYRWCLFDLINRGGLALDRAGPDLTALLARGDAVITMHTQLVLGRLGYTPAADAIADNLASTDWRVVLSAARALGALGGPRHVPALEDAMGQVSDQAAWEVSSAHLVLGGDWLRLLQSRDWYVSMSPDEQADVRDSAESSLQFARLRYEEDEGIWEGDRNTFNASFGFTFDENLNMVDRCPGLRFADSHGAEIDLTSRRLAGDFYPPSAMFEIALDDGTRLAGTRDTNPQYLGAGPGALTWFGEDGQEQVVLERAITFRLGDGYESVLFAGSGEGPSNGAVFRLERSAGAPRLVKIYELPESPLMVSRFGPERVAVLGQDQVALALTPDGAVERLTCLG